MSTLTPAADWEFEVPSLGLSLAVRGWQSDAAAVAAQPLLALHGWMDNAGTFDALLPLIDADSDCHALDFSGHGLSSHRPAGSDYYIWSYVEEVHALMETLGPGRYRLMGHSMGGAVAALVAALYPEWVSALVLLDAGGPLSTEAQALPEQMRQAFDDRHRIRQRELRYYDTREAALAARTRRGLGLQSAALLGERGIAHCSRGYYWNLDRQLQRVNPLSLTEAQVRAFLARIKAPVLLVASGETLSEMPWFAGERLDCISRLTRQTLDGGHFQHLEGQVPAVARCINRFLAGFKMGQGNAD